MERNFESVLITQCAPTLAGIKPASLFRFDSLSPAALCRTARYWDGVLSQSGLRLRVLKLCPSSHSCLLYVYRPNWIDRLLNEKEIRRFLLRQGYEEGEAASLLIQLSRKLCLKKEFPHEIGVFLGYPLEDVVGFIENKGRNYTYSGYWKSYGDPLKAQLYFDRCRRCTEIYRRRYEQGASLPHLVVAA